MAQNQSTSGSFNDVEMDPRWTVGCIELEDNPSLAVTETAPPPQLLSRDAQAGPGGPALVWTWPSVLRLSPLPRGGAVGHHPAGSAADRNQLCCSCSPRRAGMPAVADLVLTHDLDRQLLLIAIGALRHRKITAPARGRSGRQPHVSAASAWNADGAAPPAEAALSQPSCRTAVADWLGYLPLEHCERRCAHAAELEPAASSSSAWSGLKNTRSATTALTVPSGRSTTNCAPSSLCSMATIA